MQRGLRINPGAQNLWLQYFRLEFCYIEKLMGRREVLGLDDEGEGGGEGGGSARLEAMDIPLLDGEGQQAGPSFKAVKKAAAAAVALPGSSGEGGAQRAGNNGGRPAPVMNDTARRFYSGAVPLAVFRAAVKAVPGDVEFRAGFLRCCAVDFPALGTEVAEAVVASIAQDFSARCDAWELRALYPLLVAEGKGDRLEAIGGGVVSGEGGRAASAESIVLLAPAVQECVDVFECAVDAVGDREPGMWVRYASFLQERLEAEGGKVSRKRKGGGEGGHHDDARGSARGAGAVALRLQNVLSRAVEMHVSTPTSESGAISEKRPAEEKAADRTQGALSVVAKTGVSPFQEGDGAAVERRADDAREALSAGLSDVCLALDKPDAALAALRAATDLLPRRAGPWLRRAALERRMEALGGGVTSVDGADGATAAANKLSGGTAAGGGGGDVGVGKKDRGSRSSGIGQHLQSGVAVATLTAGTKAVPSTVSGYPQLWRELLASSVAAGVGKSKVAAAFRGAVGACSPSGGGDQGLAQGEFLAGYLRWSGAVEGPAAARRALQWARRSFLLAGAGAAAAYNEAIELERNLGGDGTAKRVRGLFEVMLCDTFVGGGRGRGGSRRKRERVLYDVAIRGSIKPAHPDVFCPCRKRRAGPRLFSPVYRQVTPTCSKYLFWKLPLYFACLHQAATLLSPCYYY